LFATPARDRGRRGAWLSAVDRYGVGIDS